ncbi:MAG: integration host factor, actinobacterial type [Thermoleophilia bacterium]
MTGTPPSHRTPERTSAQRLAALQRANETRSARARIKDQLRTGEVGISALLAAPPDSLLTAKLENLLLAIPHSGPVRTRTILSHCRISSSKTVGGLTPRQRHALLEYLGDGTGR